MIYMKCLNRECGSPRANEINISLNFSETEESLKTEYTGTTDYGDPSPMIGTFCLDCEEATYTPNWQETVISFIGAPLYDEVGEALHEMAVEFEIDERRTELL